METFGIYYLDSPFRSEALSLFIFNRQIDWTEGGLSIASWTFIDGGVVEASDIKDAFRRRRSFQHDKRLRRVRRGMCIGDVIVSGDIAWIVIPTGFLRLPDIIWEKARRVEQRSDRIKTKVKEEDRK